MYQCNINFRIRYAQTDKMGYCYYGRYAEFFEAARVEALRNLGVSYKELEDSGILLPVMLLNIKYIKPAYYDEVIRVETSILSLPKVKFEFAYKTFNEKNELINEAETTLVFTNDKGKPVRAPQQILEALKPYFNS